MKPSLNSVVISKSIANLDVKGLTILADKFGSRALELMLGIDTELEVSAEPKMYDKFPALLTIQNTDIFEKKLEISCSEMVTRYFETKEKAENFTSGKTYWEHAGCNQQTAAATCEATAPFARTEWMDITLYNNLKKYEEVSPKTGE